MHFIVAQPRRAEAGYLRLNAPVAVNMDSELVREVIHAGLTPSGRQIDFETRYAFGLTGSWSGEAAAVMSTSPNHVAGAEEQSALWLRLSTPW